MNTKRWSIISISLAVSRTLSLIMDSQIVLEGKITEFYNSKKQFLFPYFIMYLPFTKVETYTRKTFLKK